MGRGLIGVLTSGGDCPGLNAAIRAVGKAAHSMGMEVIGFRDGFRGLVENRTVRLDNPVLSGILTTGGTLLGTSREKPHRFPVASAGNMNMVPVAVENYHRNHLDCLVCMGGNGTQKNAKRLAEQGCNIMTLPKTIDNDVWGSDTTFGFDTAMAIGTEAIDRLHTTADSHQRIIVVELMGHKAGWLALGAGIAGGADAILIPEIPYSIDVVAEAVLARSRSGKRFSIVALAEGARPADFKEPDHSGGLWHEHSLKLVNQLEEMTSIEARFTALGHLQRGGAPTATDRLLATRVGTRCVEMIREGIQNSLVGVHGEVCVPVPLEECAGKLKTVPLDHPWLQSARLVGTTLGEA